MDKASSLARVREEALERKAQRFGRGGIQKNRLLDDADNNIGNSSIINPQQAPALVVETNPTRLLSLDALSHTGQLVTVAMTNRYLNDPPPQFGGGGFGGPIVGIAEFGNGSVFTRVEVDVPMGRVDFSGAEPQDGLTYLSVPAGTLRVYARNDGNLIPTNIFGKVNGVAEGVPPSFAIAGGNGINWARSTLVKAHAAYFTRPSTLRGPARTVFIYIGTTASPVTYSSVSAFGSAMPIPPFAKSVRIQRFPTTASMTIYFFAVASATWISEPIETVVVPSGASPDIVVPAQAIWFTVFSSSGGAGDKIIDLSAEFQIGV